MALRMALDGGYSELMGNLLADDAMLGQDIYAYLTGNIDAHADANYNSSGDYFDQGIKEAHTEVIEDQDYIEIGALINVLGQTKFGEIGEWSKKIEDILNTYHVQDKIEFIDMSDTFDEEMDTMTTGRYDDEKDMVYIHDDLSDIEVIGVMVHEGGHILLFGLGMPQSREQEIVVRYYETLAKDSIVKFLEESDIVEKGKYHYPFSTVGSIAELYPESLYQVDGGQEWLNNFEYNVFDFYESELYKMYFLEF